MSTTRYFTFEKEDKGIEREREGGREREERETSQHNIEPRQRAQLRVEIVPKRNEIDLHFQRSLIVPVPRIHRNFLCQFRSHYSVVALTSMKSSSNFTSRI